MAAAASAPANGGAPVNGAVAALVGEPGFGVRYLGRRWKRFYRNVVKRWRLWVTRRPKRRAGGLVVRGDAVLLINSRKTPNVWIVPAGTVERGETDAAAALREVEEEAGVVCALADGAAAPLGRYADDDKLVVTAYFVMTVREERPTWEDKDLGRVRKWWPLAEAADVLKERDRAPLRDYLATRRAAPRAA